MLTNAAGSLRPEVGPGTPDGDLRPHQPHRPQPADRPQRRGDRAALPEPGRRLRPRRCSPSCARAPASSDIDLAEGVYLAVSGPSFETPAEIRAFRTHGRRRGRHVDRPRDDPRPPRGDARGRRLRHLQPRRRAVRRAAEPRADPEGRRARRRRPRAGCSRTSSGRLRHDASSPRRSSAASATARRSSAEEIEWLVARHHRRLGERRAGRGAGDGDRHQRHGRRRARRADRRHDALGRGPAVGPRPPGARQALDRRRRRQGLAPARADRRGLRRRGADDLRPRPGPHRRHARQARRHPRLRHDARPRALRRHRARGGLRDHRPDGRPRAGRPAPLRHPRRHGHRRVDPAHRRLDPLQEARRRARRARHGRQGRLGRLPARARPGARAGADDHRGGGGQRPALRGAADRHGPRAGPHGRQRRRGARVDRPPHGRGERPAPARGHLRAVRAAAAPEGARRRPARRARVGRRGRGLRAHGRGARRPERPARAPRRPPARPRR